MNHNCRYFANIIWNFQHINYKSISKFKFTHIIGNTGDGDLVCILTIGPR